MAETGLVLAALLATSGFAVTYAGTPANAGSEIPASRTISIDDIDARRARIPILAALRELHIEATCKGDRIPVVPLPENLGDLRNLEVLRIGTPGHQGCAIRLSQRERETMVRLLPRARLDFTDEHDEPKELGDAGAAGLLTWPVETGNRDGERACSRDIPARTRTLLGKQLGPDLREAGERILGPSPLHHQGDASTGLAWRCWEAENGDGTTLLIGTGELDDVVRIFGPEVYFPERGSCPKSNRVHRRLATASGLRLGLARSRVMAIVGQATGEGRGWYERACYSRRRMTPQQVADWQAERYPYFTVSSIVRVLERDGRAVGIELVWAEVN